MAPVETDHGGGSLSIMLTASRPAIAAYLSYIVGKSMYRAHRVLVPEAGKEGHRQPSQRSKLMMLFGSLALLSLFSSMSSMWDYFTLSYKAWAAERGVDVPGSFYSARFRGVEDANSTFVHLGPWLRDTSVAFDALEILAEKTRRLWWGQQLDSAIVAWITLLAIEGHRRYIPHLWAYALLAHLVGLSYAQNLFYMAMLLAPWPFSPLETRLSKTFHQFFPRKHDNWFPKLAPVLGSLALSYGAIGWLSYAANTSWFAMAAVLSKLMTLSPLILTTVAPSSWGTTHPSSRDIHRETTKVFNMIALASSILHAKTSLCSFLYNLPDAYRHRHSMYIPYDTERRSRWERTATAIEKVLGSMADHPVVAAAGKDVLLSGLSLGLWAAVRALDVGCMLRSVLPWSKYHLHTEETKSGPEAPSYAQVAAAASAAAKKAATDRTIHAELRKSSTQGYGHAHHEVPPLTMNLRQRRQSSLSSETFIGHTHKPVSPTKKRGPGRPRKINPNPDSKPPSPPDTEPSEPSPTKPSLSLMEGEEEKQQLESELREWHEHPTTQLPKNRIGSAAKLAGEEEGQPDWESAALAWGMTVLGGLGVGSAGVFGGEGVKV